MKGEVKYIEQNAEKATPGECKREQDEETNEEENSCREFKQRRGGGQHDDQQKEHVNPGVCVALSVSSVCLFACLCACIHAWECDTFACPAAWVCPSCIRYFFYERGKEEKQLVGGIRLIFKRILLSLFTALC